MKPATLPIPDWLAFLLALGIVGIIAESMGVLSKSAGYIFALFVVMVYLASGGRLTRIADFFNRLNEAVRNPPAPVWSGGGSTGGAGGGGSGGAFGSP